MIEIGLNSESSTDSENLVSCSLRVMGRKLLGEIIRDQWNSIELGRRIIADGG